MIPRHSRGRNKEYVNLMTLHWKMKTYLGLVLRDKQVEKYNIFTYLEDVKRMLRNLHLCIDRIDGKLRHVDGHVPCKLDGGDLGGPFGSSACALKNVSSSSGEH